MFDVVAERRNVRGNSARDLGVLDQTHLTDDTGIAARKAMGASHGDAGPSGRAAHPSTAFGPTYLALRAFECLVALIILVVMFPFVLVLAILVKLDSPGPALFFQYRMGRGAKPFRFVKFRTMYVDARQRFPELYAYQYSEEEIKVIRFKVENDPRLTLFGRWLRKTSLDEIPNFWNVLTGDMALVGPRPEIPEMLPYYDAETLKKFSVRPGITGFAQTEGRGHLTFRDTVKLDLDYVNARSFMVDIRTILKTLKMVAVGHGAF